MKITRKKLTFFNAAGQRLAALLDLPDSPPRACALFAHCFTCGKDMSAASRIARGLARSGYAVLRFDFTGLGGSDGDFANTNFSSNVDDLIAAGDYLSEHFGTPELLVGHSLGGTAAIVAALRMPSVRAVATIAAPVNPADLVDHFGGQQHAIALEGEAEVVLAGRKFNIKKQFLEDVQRNSIAHRVGDLRRPLLVLHSPLDDIVSIDDAGIIFKAARHPKSFISLDGADHLLSRIEDAEYVAQTIAAWAGRYLAPAPARGGPAVLPGHVLVAEVNHRFTQAVHSDAHSWLADEPRAVGGDDAGPDPYEHLLAALGSCTSMTLRMYATRKQWPVTHIDVSLQHYRCHARDCGDEAAAAAAAGDAPMLHVIERAIRIDGPALTAAQRQRLMEIADRCPVHRTLANEIRITTVAAGDEADPAPGAADD